MSFTPDKNFARIIESINSPYATLTNHVRLAVRIYLRFSFSTTPGLAMRKLIVLAATAVFSSAALAIAQGNS